MAGLNEGDNKDVTVQQLVRDPVARAAWWNKAKPVVVTILVVVLLVLFGKFMTDMGW